MTIPGVGPVIATALVALAPAADGAKPSFSFGHRPRLHSTTLSHLGSVFSSGAPTAINIVGRACHPASGDTESRKGRARCPAGGHCRSSCSA